MYVIHCFTFIESLLWWFQSWNASMDTMEFEVFTICFSKLYSWMQRRAEAEKSAVRKIASSEYLLYLDHRKPLIRRLRILTVCSLYILPSILYIRDNQSGYSTIYCRDQIHSCNTREGASWTMDISRCHLSIIVIL